MLPPADYVLTIRNEEDIKFRQQLAAKKTSFKKELEVSGEGSPVNEIRVYPNPYVDNITIEMKRALDEVVLLLMDLQGRIVYRRDFHQMSGKNSIDLGRTLSAGVYLVVIRNSQEILFRERVVAQK